MSPEPARGEGHRVDGRSDIFSLGVVFYEMLVGRQPFRGDTRAELFEQVTSYEPRPLRQYDEKLPKELDRICHKALAKRASDRYSSAYDMAEDLRHFLAEQAVIQSGVSPGDIAAGESETHVSTPALTPVGSAADSSASMGSGSSSDSQPIKIVPKGLRAFDAHDADFFLELLPGPRDREGLPDSLRFALRVGLPTNCVIKSSDGRGSSDASINDRFWNGRGRVGWRPKLTGPEQFDTRFLKHAGVPQEPVAWGGQPSLARIRLEMPHLTNV